MVTVHVDHPSSILYSIYLKWSPQNNHFSSLFSTAKPWFCHNQCQSLNYTSIVHHIPHPTFTSSTPAYIIRSPAPITLQMTCSPASIISLHWLLPLDAIANFDYQCDTLGQRESQLKNCLHQFDMWVFWISKCWRVQPIVVITSVAQWEIQLNSSIGANQWAWAVFLIASESVTWSPTLTSLHDELLPGRVSQNQSILPQLTVFLVLSNTTNWDIRMSAQTFYIICVWVTSSYTCSTLLSHLTVPFENFTAWDHLSSPYLHFYSEHS